MIFERGFFKSEQLQKSDLSKALSETRNYSFKGKHEYKTTIFISHKHGDLEDVEELKGVISLLEELGAKVYIDSMDNKMPEQTSGETAARIKEIIKYCDKFILLATEKAIKSFWCNWELGIGDVYKFQRYIAILPVKEKGEYNHQYKGNEYLQIYPHIDYEDGTGTYTNGEKIPAGYYVAEPRNKDGIRYINPLKTWLNRK